MKFVNEPDEWIVTLVSGDVVRVWADSVGDLNNPEAPVRFSSLMDIAEVDQKWFQIEGQNSEKPERVIATMAEFPRAVVKTINDGIIP